MIPGLDHPNPDLEFKTFVLPPYDVFVSTPSTRLQAALHLATYAARFDEVLAGAGSPMSQARI